MFTFIPTSTAPLPMLLQPTSSVRHSPSKSMQALESCCKEKELNRTLGGHCNLMLMQLTTDDPCDERKLRAAESARMLCTRQHYSRPESAHQ